ncbi:P-loop containing nucleoside triphosphate hydrolase protein [Trematosphaeria pertusa]|uniref:P-loop containing nucleoside triphosphate hydrolase protein n=1 Tax=Trematosphaeria pertusa TaxID=390896 RepID=A0A6A6I9L1_9PLEO|nr:P-loop containing nucleoside triphosphate hydrolase protein [Trematosphaeria pertusa]KAF2246200.1 P-loop containing nucleoside triphosphate hydrolase protein [Trematosphaeria pertusa]
MDFRRLQSLKIDLTTTNSTISSLPSTLLDALIPGYGIISQIIFRLLGFDIGLVVSGIIVVFGLAKGAQVVYYRSYSLFASYFLSSVQIEDNDQLFNQMMEWIADQRMTKISRDLKAVTKWVSAYEDSDEEANASDDDVLDESGIFNYEKWASNIPPRYEPNYGSDEFWFQGRKFMFSRTRREKQRSLWSDSEDQFLSISCIGRSTEPIKELLNHVKRWTLTKENKMTSVYRPAPKEERRDCAWDRQSCRPSRPMSTVSLDQQQKAAIVMDINEYLHPASARWYAARGIPYRRGYLFYGPPGTGKTSLSFALAGIFGLDIYCISLMEVGLTESDLNKLFTTLPRRCIVLLEDIDSAGLRRSEDPPTPSDSSDTSSSDGTTSEDGSLTKISKTDALPKPPNGQQTGFKSLISLSGLLNTIDGAASHEGRVLIMTTNHPEKLDPALIRPGRVDLQVKFTLATREQTRDIFKRMYSTERDANVKSPSSPASMSSSSPTTKVMDRKFSSKREDGEFLELLNREPVLDIVEPEKLKEMAEEFAEKLPEGKFSPAEIQGFLLTRKKEPSRALKEVEGWRDDQLEVKRKDVKVVNVQ